MPLSQKLFQSLFVVFLVLLSGCDLFDDDDDSNTEVPEQLSSELPIEISAELGVTDYSGNPLPDVNVTVFLDGESTPLQTVMTSMIGSTELLELPDNADLVVHFQKSGFATQIKRLTTPGGDTRVALNVAMLERQPAQQFDVGSGAELRGLDGALLSVEADAFVDSEGNPVAGEVSLSMTPVNVATEQGMLAFPGEFRGALEDGSETLIASFGSTEYVFTQDGEELQLAPGVTATIELPMYQTSYPDGSVVAIGDMIPLWSLNEVTGLWDFEGEGQVVSSDGSPTGLAMRATVDHFSWWNTDWYPAEEERKNLTFSIIALDIDGNRLSNLNGEYAQLIFTVNTSTARYSGGGSFEIGTVYDGEIFEAHWCFRVEYYLDGTKLTSDERCMNLSGGEVIEIPIVIDAEFKVTNSLRASATMNSDYTACGDRPRIQVQSIYPVTYTLVSGSLPAGLVLEDDGRITGSPTEFGTFSFQIDVESWREDGTREEYEPVIHSMEVYTEFILEATTPAGVYIGYEYEDIDNFRQRGGMEPYRTIRLDYLGAGGAGGGTVPEGMEFDDGVLSGTPGRLLVNNEPSLLYFSLVNVVATDNNCARAYDGYDLPVIWGPLLEGVAPAAQVGQPYSFTLSNTEGPIEFWEQAQGGDGLPGWATLDFETGEITGTPQPEDANQTNNVIIKASGPEIASIIFGDFRPEGFHEISLTVFMAPPEVVALNETFVVATGQPITVTPVNIGEVAQFWEVDNAPPWATLDTATGELSGTPSGIESYDDVLIRAVNAGGVSDTGTFSIEVINSIVAPALAANPAAATVAVNYGFTVVNSGGQPDSWGINGSLPPGLVFNDGVFSGLPTTAGVYGDIEVTASNSGGTDSLILTIEVGPGAQSPLNFADPGPITVRSDAPAFTNTVSGGSGTGAVTYNSADTLIAEVDTVTGEVTLIGEGTVSITATKAADSNYNSVAVSYELTVEAPISIEGTPPTATSGDFYTWTPTVNGATVVAWSVDSGSLPGGLSISTETGAISGFVGASEGSYPVTLSAITSDSAQLLNDFVFNVVEADCIAGSEGFCELAAFLGTQVSFDFALARITNPTWSLGGDLPDGLTLNTETGEISGTPIETGVFIFDLHATDGVDTESYFISLEVFAMQPL